MFIHELPSDNRVAIIDKVIYSDNALQECIDMKKPMIFTGMTNNWTANSWTPQSLIEKCHDKKIYIKNLKNNIKSKCDFDVALKRIVEQSDVNDDGNIVIQMAQIITNGFFSRGKPCLDNLQSDIDIPIPVPSKKVLEVNLWAGSGGGVTELHYDPVDNLLSVIKGIKKIVIFAPRETRNLYNAPSSITGKSPTHSFVDIRNINRALYPKILNAKYYECTVEEGESLFLPCGYWHVVQSLGLNIAVNIWWIPKLIEFFKAPCRHFWLTEFVSRLKKKGTCVPHSV